jgi:predicted acyltransferase
MHAATNTPAASPRIPSVDAMRGATMAAMIVVNNPGSWLHMLSSLAHAEWGALPAPADFVFPFFLFLVGVSAPLALRRRLAAGAQAGPILVLAARRALVLFAIGVFLNLFPAFDLQTVRIPGVLQRIAVVSLTCTWIALRMRPRQVLASTLALLVGYALLLRLVPVPGHGVAMLTPEVSLPVWFDELLLGAHTWRGPGDPEGVLSTLGAIATGWMGVWAGQLLVSAAPDRNVLKSLWVAAGIAVALGAASSLVLPIAKEVWTSSYTLLTGGAALVALALVHREFAGRAPGRDHGWLFLLGRQALLAYVVAHLYSDLSIFVVRLPLGESGSISLHSWIYQKVLLSWLPQGVASLAYALLFLGVVVATVAGLDRRRIRIRL